MGASYAVVSACNRVAGALDNYCFDLEVVGIPKVLCGEDFQALCHDWNTLGEKRLLFSGFFAFVAHFYLVAATGFAAQQRRSIPALLQQYNLMMTWKRGSQSGGSSIKQDDNEEPEAPAD